MDENCYIKSFQRGDTQAFRETFDCFHARLCYFASSLLPKEYDPEDIVQEVFVKLWQKKEQFSDSETIKAFLYIAVKNACINIYKHDKIVKKYSDLLGAEEAEEDNTIAHIVETEVLDNIHRALQKLPAGCRNILELSYFQELKNKEIAEQLQISINTVKTQKKRALHLLRAIMKVTSLWLY